MRLKPAARASRPTAAVLLLAIAGVGLGQPKSIAPVDLAPEVVKRFEQFQAKYGHFKITRFRGPELDRGFINYGLTEFVPFEGELNSIGKGRLTKVDGYQGRSPFFPMPGGVDAAPARILPGFESLAIPDGSKPFDLPRLDQPFGLFLGVRETYGQSPNAFWPLGLTDDAIASVKRLDRLEIFERLELLDLSGWQSLEPEIFESVARLKSLHHLCLNHTNIVDANLRTLSQLGQLETLELDSCTGDNPSSRDSYRSNEKTREEVPFTGIGLSELTKLPNLRILSLADCKHLSEAGANALATLQQIESLNLATNDVSEVALEKIFELRGLRYLRLNGCSLERFPTIDPAGQSGARGNRGLGKLKALDIGGISIGDEALKEIGKLEQLEALSLASCEKVSDESLRELAALTRLTALDASKTPIGDPGLAAIARIGGLQSLDLSRCKVTAKGLAELRKLNHLTALNLTSSDVDDKGLAIVAGIPELEFLNIGACDRVTDAGLQELSRSRKLKYVCIDGCAKLGDAGLKSLAAIQTLERLSANECHGFTDVGVKELGKLPHLETLEFDSCDKITAAAFDDKANFKSLRRLFLVGIESIDGEAIFKTLPDCQITMSKAVDYPVSNSAPIDNPVKSDPTEIWSAVIATAIFLIVVAGVLLLVFWRRKNVDFGDD